MRVKCLAQEVSTQCPWPGLEPGPLAVESSTLNMRMQPPTEQDSVTCNI